jgi:hypothetical protein
MLIMQIFTGNVPFCDVSNDAAITLKIIQGVRPSRPSHNISVTHGLDDEMWYLIEDCWKTQPMERPGASEVVRRLLCRPNVDICQRWPCDWDESFIFRLRSSMKEQPFYELAANLTKDTGADRQ